MTIISRLWNAVKLHSSIIFPALALAWSIFILLSPQLTDVLSTIISNSFSRFVIFWVLGVLLVLSFNRFRFSAPKIALISIAMASLVITLYVLVVYPTMESKQLNNLIFSCSSGVILGSLAGTWGKYIFEVYIDEFGA